MPQIAAGCGRHIGLTRQIFRKSGTMPSARDRRAGLRVITPATRVLLAGVLLPVDCSSEVPFLPWGTWADLDDDTRRESHMKEPPIVSREEWMAARERMLLKERDLTRAHDALAAERRRMPWMAVDKEYWFDGPAGRVSLLDLFEDRRQLIVYRAFYGPEVTTYAEGGSYPERACVGCSLGADQVAHPGHLHARNTSLAWVSRAPQADIQSLKKRHGWEHIPWYTITDDFDKDFDVDEWHGTNAFIREGDRIFRTYSLTLEETSRWVGPGTTSTSRRSVVRKSGRTRPRGTRRLRHINGGTITTRTRPDLGTST